MKYFHFQTEFTLASFRCLKSSIDRFQFFTSSVARFTAKKKSNLHCFIQRLKIGIEHDPFALYNIPLFGGVWMSRSWLRDDPKVHLLLNKNKLERLISNITFKKEISVFQFLKDTSLSQLRITLEVYFGQTFFRLLTCVTCFLLLFEKHSSHWNRIASISNRMLNWQP